MLRPWMVPVRRQADPSPPVSQTEELFLMESLLVFKYKINGSSEFVGQDGKGFGFAVFMSKPLQVLFPWFVAFEEQDGCFGESPLEMGVADLFTA